MRMERSSSIIWPLCCDSHVTLSASLSASAAACLLTFFFFSQLWDLHAGSVILDYKGHSKAITAVALNDCS